MPAADGDRRWPGALYGGGEEPDARFSLANERTFLAWIRTGLSLLAAAAAVQVIDGWWPLWFRVLLSAMLTGTGVVCAIQAWRGWFHTEKALRHGRALPDQRVNVILVFALVLAAISLLGVGVATGFGHG
ncbi:YidH family protein [Nocardia rhizosphaerihabitans]|uniref:YidH family protein n=1 Tax=Nocardia rhizosphaerihabitans TaxID=1691570 RepID=UPI00366BF3D5